MTDVLKIKLGDVVVDVEMDDNGRYCLNDVFKASGKGQTKKPSEWLRNSGKRVSAVKVEGGISTLQNINFSKTVFQMRVGKTIKSFACKRLVLKYAGWISEEFEDAVYEAFEYLTEGRRDEAAATATSVAISPELINTWKKEHKKLMTLVSDKFSDDKYAHNNYSRLVTKASTGYSPTVLHGNLKTTALEYMVELDHWPAIEAGVQTMIQMRKLIEGGKMNYHDIAAHFEVETTKNKALYKRIKSVL